MNKTVSVKRKLPLSMDQDEDSDTVASLEEKIEKLQAVLHNLTLQRASQGPTWTPDIEDFNVGSCPYIPPGLANTVSSVSPSSYLEQISQPESIASPHLPIVFPQLEDEIFKFLASASFAYEPTPLEVYQLPSPDIVAALVTEAFQTNFILNHILSKEDILGYLAPSNILRLSEALILHGLCQLAVFSMRWDDLQLLLSSHLPYWTNTVSEPVLEKCLAGNCCSVEMYKKHINPDGLPKDWELKRSILEHHSQFIKTHTGQNLEEIQNEDDGRGLERLAKASVLCCLDCNCGYNTGQIWRVKSLRLCVMLGWNREEVLAACSPRERYERSMTFYFMVSYESVAAILRRDSPCISAEDIQIPLPSSHPEKTTARLWLHSPSFYTEESPLQDLEANCILFKCSLLLTKVAEYWRHLERSSKEIDVERIEASDEFISIAQMCKNFQRSFPVSYLATLSYKATFDLSQDELKDRDFLHNAQCALSAAIILMHHRIPDPTPEKLSPSFNISHGAAQTVLCLLPLFCKTVAERRHSATVFSYVMGIAGKVLFRNLCIIRQREGESEETFKMEMSFLQAVEKLKDVALEWRNVAPTIIPLIILSQNPEICLQKEYSLTAAGRT
ncbi:hypothetical protein BT69DRAFT_1279189 [Atractiella rhizophila]|nr:hypothetical protein BT69DRAFT_1279189 [Atractiella rhizophila]